jgi:hypothetical protein
VQPLVDLLQQEVIEAALRAVQPLEGFQRQLAPRGSRAAR